MYLNEKILSTSKTDRRAQFPKKKKMQFSAHKTLLLFFAYLSHFFLKHSVPNHFMYTPSLASLVYEIELFGLQSEF